MKWFSIFKTRPALPKPIDPVEEMDKLIRERLINMISCPGFIHEPAVNGVLDCMNVEGHLHPNHPRVKRLQENLLELTSSTMVLDTTKPYIRALMLLSPSDLHWHVAQKDNGGEPQLV